MRSIVCVRECVGYARMTTSDGLALLNTVYRLMPLMDFFMPTMKLGTSQSEVSMVRTGSKESGKYDEPASPRHV
jgi:hypothetical protein